jgi:hypothetical protein
MTSQCVLTVTNRLHEAKSNTRSVPVHCSQYGARRTSNNTTAELGTPKTIMESVNTNRYCLSFYAHIGVLCAVLSYHPFFAHIHALICIFLPFISNFPRTPSAIVHILTHWVYLLHFCSLNLHRLDRSREKWRSITQSQGAEESPARYKWTEG